MRIPPSAPPENGGTTPITLHQRTHNPAWGGSGTAATPVLCQSPRQPGRGWVQVVWGIYYCILAGMLSITITGLVVWWESHQEFKRIQQEQTRTYNESIREMERILTQMKKQKVQLEEEAKQ